MAMSSCGRDRLKTVADLYILPADTVPRYKYFRGRATNLMTRTCHLLGKFGLEKGASKTLVETVKRMADKIHILVTGSQRTSVHFSDFVKKKKEDGSKQVQPVKVRESHMASLNNISDIIVIPFPDNKDTKMLKVGHLPDTVLDGIIYVNMAQSEAKGKQSLDELQDFYSNNLVWTREELLKHCTTKDDLASRISDALEHRVLSCLSMVDKMVGNCLAGIPRDLFQEEDTKEVLSKLLHENPYLLGWYEEISVSNTNKNTTKSNKNPHDIAAAHERCKHFGPTENCRTCLLLEKLGDVVCNLVRAEIDHSIIKSGDEFRAIWNKPEVTQRVFDEMNLNITSKVAGKMLPTREKRQKRKIIRAAQDHEHKPEGMADHASESQNKSKGRTSPKLLDEVEEVHNLRQKDQLVVDILGLQKTAIGSLFDHVKKIWIKKLRQVHWELTGLYEESNLAQFQNQKKTEPVLSDAGKAELFKRLKFVKGCGYCFGELRIDVTDLNTQKETITQQISNFLKQYNITKFKLVQAGAIRMFHGAGSVVKADDGTIVQATLGGMATVIRPTASPNEQLCALVSKHLLSRETKRIIVESEGEDQLEVLNCLKNGRCIVGESLFDMAAIVLGEDQNDVFKKEFKDSEGREKKGRLIGLQTGTIGDPIKGLRKVHIWGAKSKPGRGIIGSTSFDCIGPDGDQCHLLLIDDDLEWDTEEDTPFAKEGDSGSILLMDNDPDNVNSMRIVAMLIGKMQDEGGLYCAFRLVDGLRNLISVTKGRQNPITGIEIDGTLVEVDN